jgi:hypothetical protein
LALMTAEQTVGHWVDQSEQRKVAKTAASMVAVWALLLETRSAQHSAQL